MVKKTYNEKLNDTKNMPLVEKVSPECAARFGGFNMLIAPPLAYNAIMKQVPYGKIVTTACMRAHLARKHNADWTCPLTAGIFVNICANAAEERSDEKFPYWRTVKSDGELCEKFPHGLNGHRHLLEKEGHKIVQKGKRFFVENFEAKLHEIKETSNNNYK